MTVAQALGRRIQHSCVSKWPGNVRELENLVHRLVVLRKSGRIPADDLPSHISDGKAHTLDIAKSPFSGYLVSPPTTWPELKRRRRQMLSIASNYAQKLEERFIEDLLKKPTETSDEQLKSPGCIGRYFISY